MKYILFAATLLLSALTLRAQQVDSIFRLGHLVQKNFATTLPARSWGFNLLVDVKLNGVEGEMIFDTGAGFSVIDDDVAKETKLKELIDVSVKDGGGFKNEMKITSIDSIELNGV